MLEDYGYKFPYEKVKIPFPERGKKVRWPNGNILAVRICISLEIFGKRTLPGGPGAYVEGIGGANDIGGLSEQDGYNLDVGTWRILDLLDKHNLKGTAFICGAAAQYCPDLVKEIKKRGHEIAGHGYYESRGPAAMTLDEEKDDISKTTAILESVTGERPCGWVNPMAAPSNSSFKLLVEHGYLWHGDLRDDDLPYGIKVNNKILVEIPHKTMTTNDFSIFAGQAGMHSHVRAIRSPKEATKFFQDTFDAYYETAIIEGPQLLTFGVHPFSSCLSDRIRAIDRMLGYMKSFPHVWIAISRDIARYWKDNYL